MRAGRGGAPPASTANPGIAEGDMVVTPSGKVGLLTELHFTDRGAAVMFTSGGQLVGYNWKNLRSATMKEIIAAGLDGVGCNQGGGRLVFRGQVKQKGGT